jgi:hypothetical protein
VKISGQSGRTIAPGASEKAVFEVATGRRQGKLTKRFTVSSNDRENAMVRLTGNVDVKTAMNTASPTINFGSVSRKDGVQTKTIKLTRGAGGPIAPRIERIGKGVKAEVSEIKAGEEYELTVTVGPPWPDNNRVRSSLTLETGVAEAPQQTLTVYAAVKPRLRVSPARFVVQTGSDEPLELTARLDWQEGPPGRVLGVTINDDELKVHLEEKGARQIVVLDVPANFKQERRKQLHVTLETDDELVRAKTIPVYVTQTRRPTAPGRVPSGRPRVMSPTEKGRLTAKDDPAGEKPDAVQPTQRMAPSKPTGDDAKSKGSEAKAGAGSSAAADSANAGAAE